MVGNVQPPLRAGEKPTAHIAQHLTSSDGCLLPRGIGIEQVQLRLRECLRAVSDLKEEEGHGRKILERGKSSEAGVRP